MVKKTKEKGKQSDLKSKILNYLPWKTTPTEESKKESTQPGRLEKLLVEAGIIAIRISVIAVGFLLGGPIGGAIAIGLVVVDSISNGKLIKGVAKALNVGYDALNWVKDKTLDAGKWAVDKVRSSEKVIEEKPIHNFKNPAYSPDIKSKSGEEGVDGKTQNTDRQIVGAFTKKEVEKAFKSNIKFK